VPARSPLVTAVPKVVIAAGPPATAVTSLATAPRPLVTAFTKLESTPRRPMTATTRPVAGRSLLVTASTRRGTAPWRRVTGLPRLPTVSGPAVPTASKLVPPVGAFLVPVSKLATVRRSLVTSAGALVPAPRPLPTPHKRGAPRSSSVAFLLGAWTPGGSSQMACASAEARRLRRSSSTMGGGRRGERGRAHGGCAGARGSPECRRGRPGPAS